MSDGIDLATVEIHNSWDIRSWPATATITRLEFRPTGVHVDFTKNLGAGAWPNFRPAGWDGDLQYTLWIVLNINGQWHASGCIEYWQSCDQNGGPPEEFAQNWYYAADRWGPMTGHQPAPGELVGFLVTAGDARNNGQQSVQERSNVVVLPFPSSGAVYVPPVVVDPPPEPTTGDPGPAPVPVPPVLTPAILEVLEHLVAVMDLQTDAIHTLQRTVATREDITQARQALLAAVKLLSAALTPKAIPR